MKGRPPARERASLVAEHAARVEREGRAQSQTGCRVPGCAVKRSAKPLVRGLCHPHYTRAMRLVSRGEATWETLVLATLDVSRRRGRRTDEAIYGFTWLVMSGATVEFCPDVVEEGSIAPASICLTVGGEQTDVERLPGETDSQIFARAVQLARASS